MYTLFTDNHDQPHFIVRGGYDGSNRYEVASMYAAMVYLLKGIPFIYQGQEFGTVDPHYDSIEDYDDIETVNYYNEHKNDRDIIQKINVGSRDNARRPMCWDNSENYGFSRADKTWIKLHSRGGEDNLEDDKRGTQSVFAFYKQLLALRKDGHIFLWTFFCSYRVLKQTFFPVNSDSIISPYGLADSTNLIVKRASSELSCNRSGTEISSSFVAFSMKEYIDPFMGNRQKRANKKPQRVHINHPWAAFYIIIIAFL